MSVHRGYAAVSFGQIHYRYAGAGDKPVIVLLHQTPSTSEMYVELMQLLSNDYRLLAPDTPGMGMSDMIDGELTITGLADGLAEFLDEVSIDRCFVFGHHTGATIATELAARHPDVVDAIALSGPTLLNDELISKLRAVSTAIPITADGSHFQAMWDRLGSKDTAAPLSVVLRETINGLQLGDRYPDAYGAVIDHDFRAAAAAIQCPALVFAGTLDPLFGQMDAACEQLQQGSKAIIDGAKTFVCETHTEEVAQLLRDFFPRELA
jgi:haloalkane dehalogenase